MAKITFTDSIGAATLTNGKPAPADRFANWAPRSRPVGDAIEIDSTGARVLFQVRDDWGATFELRGIPSETVDGVSMADVADRLCRHVLLGGQFAIATEDAASHSYATVGLAPGTDPQLVMSNPKTVEYTLTLAVVNLAVTPTQMVCHYRGGT